MGRALKPLFVWSLVVIVSVGVHFGQAAAQQSVAGVMSAKNAYEGARSGDLLLLDIRTEGEWKKTGIGEGAKPLTMHQSAAGFFKQLETLTQNDKKLPIALICATGGRSAFLLPHLKKAGYSNIVDVGEGMMGSRYGPGWIKAGLPVKKYE